MTSAEGAQEPAEGSSTPQLRSLCSPRKEQHNRERAAEGFRWSAFKHSLANHLNVGRGNVPLTPPSAATPGLQLPPLPFLPPFPHRESTSQPAPVLSTIHNPVIQWPWPARAPTEAMEVSPQLHQFFSSRDPTGCSGALHGAAPASAPRSASRRACRAERVTLLKSDKLPGKAPPAPQLRCAQRNSPVPH